MAEPKIQTWGYRLKEGTDPTGSFDNDSIGKTIDAQLFDGKLPDGWHSNPGDCVGANTPKTLPDDKPTLKLGKGK